jgi:hypothetical protein
MPPVALEEVVDARRDDSVTTASRHLLGGCCSVVGAHSRLDV